ncbi:MAG TPA: hypothetical protein ENH41_00005 [Candidatus Omnitrophica bacterium]|nr:hypothetical protein [Candidatus Omnitrophota bacterium]
MKKIGLVSTLGIKPDLTILLVTDTEKGLNCSGRIKDRIESKSLAYHKRVRRGYLKLAREDPRRIKIVNQDVLISRTQDIIRELIDKIIKK